MQRFKTPLAAFCAAVALITIPLGATADSFVRVPIVSHAQVDNGGTSPATSESVEDPNPTPPAITTASVDLDIAAKAVMIPGSDTECYLAFVGGATHLVDTYDASDTSDLTATKTMKVECFDNGSAPATATFSLTAPSGGALTNGANSLSYGLSLGKSSGTISVPTGGSMASTNFTVTMTVPAGQSLKASSYSSVAQVVLNSTVSY